MLYAVVEFVDLYKREGEIISTHTVLNHFDKEYEFNSDKMGNGFEIAFGWTAYDNNYEMLHEPQYGELRVIRKAWSGDEFMEYIEYPFRTCTDEEIGSGVDGFDNPRSRFYQISPASKVWYDLYRKKLNCIDHKIVISGDYDSESVKHLSIRFMKCDPEVRSDCKSEDEINEYIKNKFIVLMYN